MRRDGRQVAGVVGGGCRWSCPRPGRRRTARSGRRRPRTGRRGRRDRRRTPAPGSGAGTRRCRPRRRRGRPSRGSEWRSARSRGPGRPSARCPPGRSPAARHVEELLHDLGADEPPPGLQRLGDELASPPLLRRGPIVERVDEDVRVEEVPTAHSARPGRRTAPHERRPGAPSAPRSEAAPRPGPRSGPATPRRSSPSTSPRTRSGTTPPGTCSCSSPISGVRSRST